MKLGMACLLVLVVLAPTGRSQEKKVADLDQIQGLWKAISAESEGEAIDANIVKDMYIAFAGDRMIAFGEGDFIDAIYVFKLNTKAKLKEIDLSLKVEGKTATAGGIYELDGHTLKLCWDQDGGKRPTSFVTPRDGRVFSVVLKQQKPKTE